MTSPEQITTYNWPSIEFPVCEVDVRLSELATRLGFQVESWEEDGLGPAVGFLFRLPSGLVVLAQELEHAVQSLGSKGPTLYVDSTDVVARGIGPVIDEILSCLSLTRSNVTWAVGDPANEKARQMVSQAQSYLRAKAEGK